MYESKRVGERIKAKEWRRLLVDGAVDPDNKARIILSSRRVKQRNQGPQAIALALLPLYRGTVKRRGKAKQDRLVELDLVKDGIRRIDDLAAGRVTGLTEKEFLAAISQFAENAAETDPPSGG